MPNGKTTLKLSLMVVVFEAPVADVWFTRGSGNSEMCPLRNLAHSRISTERSRLARARRVRYQP